MTRFPLSAIIIGLFVMVSAHSVDAFLGGAMPKFFVVANPAVKDLAKAQEGILLDLKLDVGRKEGSHFPIDGLCVELGPMDTTPSKKDRTSLPGSSGPSPHLSSGLHGLNILDGARFIDMEGAKTVDLEGPSWELVWREDAPAGTLILGFTLSNDVSKNDAVLPKGRVYMSLPVWEHKRLTEQQAHKAKKIEEAKEWQIDQEEQIAKMQSTSNPLMKALHYRNAIATTEKISMSGLHTFLKSIPSEDEVLPINKDLLVCTTGTVWTKGSGFMGKEHVLLGAVNASPEKSSSEEA